MVIGLYQSDPVVIVWGVVFITNTVGVVQVSEVSFQRKNTSPDFQKLVQSSIGALLGSSAVTVVATSFHTTPSNWWAVVPSYQ
jgi:hypothetical protein